jgi:uncharacterized protein YqjF (DUF2071 family)
MKREPINDVDRLSVRTRPPGWPIMYQSWGKLLFVHWPVPAELLRPLIPDPLVIDTFNASAWLGITPFTMWGVRPVFLPPIPIVSQSHELNVRTYVHLDGVPGIWFFSLDASNPIAVLGARLTFYLPYFNARMSLEQRDRTIYFKAHSPRRCTRRVRSCLDGWREVAAVRARFSDFLSDRALLPVFRSRGRPLPGPNLPSSLASARSSPAVM